MNRSLLLRALCIVVVFVVAILVKQVLLGNATVIHLNSAAALTGQISQTLGSTSSQAPPKAGTDFKLTGTRYFDNNKWVVTQIVALNSTANTGYVVLQDRLGYFQTVLGPGTSFPVDATNSIPADITQYLTNLGLLYDTNS